MDDQDALKCGVFVAYSMYVCTHTVCVSRYARTYTLRSLVETHQYAEGDRLAQQVVRYTIHMHCTTAMLLQLTAAKNANT